MRVAEWVFSLISSLSWNDSIMSVGLRCHGERSDRTLRYTIVLDPGIHLAGGSCIETLTLRWLPTIFQPSSNPLPTPLLNRSIIVPIPTLADLVIDFV